MSRFKQICSALVICAFVTYINISSAQSIEKESASDGLLKVPAIGKVIAKSKVNITNLSEGRIIWLAEPGDVVKKDQPLVKLSNQKLSLYLNVLDAEKLKLEEKITYLNTLVAMSNKLYSTKGVSLDKLNELKHNLKLFIGKILRS